MSKLYTEKNINTRVCNSVFLEFIEKQILSNSSLDFGAQFYFDVKQRSITKREIKWIHKRIYNFRTKQYCEALFITYVKQNEF